MTACEFLSVSSAPSTLSRGISRQTSLFCSSCSRSRLEFRSFGFRRISSSLGEIRAVNGRTGGNLSPWDEKPFELLPSGKKAYYDEQDIVTFLDPPKELIPLDPASFNPAAYLWRKIGDIPEERRYRLLTLLKPRLISRMWEIAGTRYEDNKLVKKSASSLLSDENSAPSIEFWNCRTSGGPMPISWINFFNKGIFCSDNGNTYGRLRLVKHQWPFNDHLVVYIRHVGPGTLVGQAWQEGKVLEQVPRKLCGEILMVKDYAGGGQHH